jgi:hypothetical protein
MNIADFPKMCTANFLTMPKRRKLGAKKSRHNRKAMAGFFIT